MGWAQGWILIFFSSKFSKFLQIFRHFICFKFSAKSSKAGSFSYQFNNVQSTMHSYIILFLFTHMCTILQACFPHMYTILHNLETNLFWLSCKQFLWILWHLKFTGCVCQHPNVIVWLNWNLKSFSQHHLQLIY